MKQVHTQKKSANRPWNGVRPKFGFNFMNSAVDANGMKFGHGPSQKKAQPAYKRSTPLN